MSGTQDATFVQQIADSNMTEIAEGTLALSQSSTAAVSVYGAWLATDHSSSNVMLYQAASAAGIAMPSTLDATDQAQVTSLSQLTGQQFDLNFLTAQVTGHEATLQNLETEVNSGSNAGLISYAQSMLPMITAHLNTAENLLALESNGGQTAVAAAMTPQFIASMMSDLVPTSTTPAATPASAPIAPALTGGTQPQPPSAADLIAPHTAHALI